MWPSTSHFAMVGSMFVSLAMRAEHNGRAPAARFLACTLLALPRIMKASFNWLKFMKGIRNSAIRAMTCMLVFGFLMCKT